MANALYPKFKELLLSGGINMTSDTIKAMLVKTGYTYNATHQYVSDVSTYDNGRSSALSNKTVTDGIFDADDITITATTNTQVIAIVLYKDTTEDTTSPLIAYIDNVAGIPFTPAANGVVQIIWDNGAYKIFSL